MRADRLLRLLWLLRGRSGTVPARELATALEVSARTVLRDVEALSAAGVPVYTERGRHGGIMLLADYRPDVLGLSDDEALALTAVVSTPSAGALGLEALLQSAMGKIRRTVDRDAALVGSRILIDPAGWLSKSTGLPIIDVLDAVQGLRRVCFRYSSGRSGRISDVSTTALGLLCAASDWYLVAGAAECIRFYRLDRLECLRVGEVDADAPQIDLAEEWARARRGFQERFSPMTATLEVERCALGVLRGLVAVEEMEGAVEADELVMEGGEPEGSESLSAVVRMRALFADVSHATEVLPRLSAHVRVLDPPELKRALHDLAEQVLAAVQ
ncbi:helix-turn-helix transcriptional regulator [Actinomyces bowdenii]|uniref:WYL domain-containing protein n=1 Tax=Actinomyces bowdenii TaxID=131109 RepID=A0A3P1VBZ4_9ACTO|nr:WYL domain-containing protein [Actinomyces bowdenii]RRD30093.1 WYL domain-containing protein [Actinomyces bowdenii]